jgi:predicted HTH transcriptional regulator
MGKKGITDIDFGLEIIGIERFAEYMNEICNEKPLEPEERKTRLTDEELTERILKEFCIKAPLIQNEVKEKRNKILKSILKDERISTRQLARVTGVSTNIIWKL